jgi:hypothetical protein
MTLRTTDDAHECIAVNRIRLDLGPEASALPIPGGDDFVPKEGEQQPRNAYYEPECAGAVSGLSECPDAERGEGYGKDEPPDTELARSHASDGTSDPRIRWLLGSASLSSSPPLAKSAELQGNRAEGFPR